MHFVDRLFSAIRRVQNPVVVGVDPRPDELPPGYLERFPANLEGVVAALGQFGRDLIDIVATRVAAVKFQSAFYEAYGPQGVAVLHASAEYAREKGLMVIFDGKRNDIGSTAEAYARGYLGKVPMGESFEPCWNLDALTINAYLGAEGIVPFVKVAARENKGLFVVVRTSNHSAGDFQDLVADGKPVYRHVAEHVKQWGQAYVGQEGYSLVGAVVGATYPAQLAELREAMPQTLFLVPGYGTQGGTSAEVAHAFASNGLGAVVNNSRGIAFAYGKAAYKARFGTNWQGAVEQALVDMIDDLAANTPAGRLRG